MPSKPTNSARLLAVVVVAQVLSVANSTMIAVALPELSRDLDVSGSEQQWIVDTFILIFASLLIAGGVLGDRRGRRKALIAGLTIFAAGSLWCTLSPNVATLLAGRVVQGLGPPLVLPASLAIVSTLYREPAPARSASGARAPASASRSDR